MLIINNYQHSNFQITNLFIVENDCKKKNSPYKVNIFNNVIIKKLSSNLV